MHLLALILGIFSVLVIHVAAKPPAEHPSGFWDPNDPHWQWFWRKYDPKYGYESYVRNISEHRRANILLTNDDGWAEKQLRVFYETLSNWGHNVYVYAPDKDVSKPGKVIADSLEYYRIGDDNLGSWKGKCQYKSCQDANPKDVVGFNVTDPRLNWVRGSPIGALLYGVNETKKAFAAMNESHTELDMVLVGPNIGHNYGYKNGKSGSTALLKAASSERLKLSAISFAGWNKKKTPWYKESTRELETYAYLSLGVTNRILENGYPFLPQDLPLNVNFPKYRHDKQCSHENFKFVLSRAYMWKPMLSHGPDLEICDSKHLPTECSVVSRKEEGVCYVSITPMNGKTKGTADRDNQVAALKRLEGYLSCLPKQKFSKSFMTNLGCGLRFWDWF
ncbi:survival protein sure-like phosphatase/nucleotidase [Phyllosticta citriasiana]|uniref:Survival protein sure-like phosphatase/nucleotidase n=1 Tax=Phyllosticta citriasiana TaxID=595635 RepID=A0ABR1KYG9_9PEZI